MRDDLKAKLERFEERTKDKGEAETTAARFARHVLFNRQELLLRTIAQAALDACRELDIPPSAAHGELVPNPEAKRFEVHLIIDDGVAKARAPDDEKITSVMHATFAKALLDSAPARERLQADIDAFPPAEEVHEDVAAARIKTWFKGLTA